MSLTAVAVPPCLLQVIRQQQIHQRLQIILSDMVARERGGEIVDKALLRSITQVRLDTRLICSIQQWCAVCARIS